ncbi:NAD-dependent epimerase/dehydratase family protein [Gracilibacillus dipsosauri]|uniref:NAD-dependent epimerase/dehydratase family protein n=1 Tax=Gracilibacillus dipsosauri TaxID=178340 RepID=UPI00240A009F
MEVAMVLGATGGVGAAITNELDIRGVKSILFGRSKEKLEQLKSKLHHPHLFTLAVGDAMKTTDLEKAGINADVIFHCANVPYHKMEEQLLDLGESVMTFAHRFQKKVIVADGIYPYGKRTMAPATEAHPKNPHTRKGKVRLDYENLVFDNRFANAMPMIVRLPDYYGPTANDASYLGMTMKDIARNKSTFFLGNMRIPREFVYLPDAAKMILELAYHDDAYRQNWHIPGPGLISGRDIVKIAQQVNGSNKIVLPLGKFSLSILGLFQPVMKEVVEMLYLTEEPFVLNGEKTKNKLGTIPQTPFEQGISETIYALKKGRIHP